MQAFDKRILKTFSAKKLKLKKTATITKNSCHLTLIVILFMLIFAIGRKLFCFSH